MNWPPPDAEGRPAAVPAARSVTLKTPPECRKVTITGEGRRILPLHVGEGPAVPTPLRTRSWACRRSRHGGDRPPLRSGNLHASLASAPSRAVRGCVCKCPFSS